LSKKPNYSSETFQISSIQRNGCVCVLEQKRKFKLPNHPAPIITKHSDLLQQEIPPPPHPTHTHLFLSQFRSLESTVYLPDVIGGRMGVPGGPDGGPGPGGPGGPGGEGPTPGVLAAPGVEAGEWLLGEVTGVSGFSPGEGGGGPAPVVTVPGAAVVTTCCFFIICSRCWNVSLNGLLSWVRERHTTIIVYCTHTFEKLVHDFLRTHTHTPFPPQQQPPPHTHTHTLPLPTTHKHTHKHALPFPTTHKHTHTQTNFNRSMLVFYNSTLHTF
jgi:hypothetical protein